MPFFLKVDATEIGDGHHFAITFLFLGQGLAGCYLLGDYLPDRTFLGSVQFGQIFPQVEFVLHYVFGFIFNGLIHLFDIGS